MGLPGITPYPMPDTLPANRVDWTPDPARAVLLVHDMQNYFVDAYRRDASPIPELVANILALRSRCATLGIPVVYTAQPGAQTLAQRGLLQDFWGDGVPGDPPAARIIDPLLPADNDIQLTKWRYSAFQRTSLARILTELDRDQLVITGVYAHIGCLMTACEAFMRDIETFFAADATADFSAEHHAMAITYAAERCAVVLNTSDLLTALSRDRASVSSRTAS
ncbi:bifunctional isochorismate lyase/aryl carrier protein [Actinomadura pelletieri DSM 43383]|uniref:Bifunctional isochorismate lyase/aryl carrier protein n=1 Tax=Actinomadura pelletieri DSM 43383 TaxID=1120940 RepID=A0A495QU00_9ACTN|nr:isochorismatase family protein [Actinomadura pelletieri]RKS76994.1 bifunctional isochorismate lyase/aryl carrier protein [Actinomadura pelletieri DSM 43383]